MKIKAFLFLNSLFLVALTLSIAFVLNHRVDSTIIILVFVMVITIIVTSFIFYSAYENLEKKVGMRTKELEVACKDLDSFAYSASHDLRAPLRAIDGFSQIIEEDYADKLDDEGKKNISIIRDSAKKMGILINDLLAFSRSGRKEPEIRKVEMTPLVKEVFEEIKNVSPERKIEFICPELPAASADKVLIRQVWENFLSNAVKFTQYKENAVIEVGSKMKDDQIIYFVRDNGAGFDMQYAGKLFGVFQRLHDSQKFEGTGVGLAIVQRIIAKHGGKVWADGAVDQGATFYFSLPK